MWFHFPDFHSTHLSKIPSVLCVSEITASRVISIFVNKQPKALLDRPSGLGCHGG